MERVRELAAGVQVKDCTDVLPSSSKAKAQQKQLHQQQPSQVGSGANSSPSQASGVGVTSQGFPQLPVGGAPGMMQGLGALTSTLGMLGANSQSQGNQNRKRGFRDRDRNREPVDEDIGRLRRLGDHLRHLLERPAAVVSQPFNILNNAAQKVQEKLDLEYTAKLIEVEEDGEMKQKRDSWVVSIYMGDMKLVTFNGPKGMFKNDCKTAAGEELINMLLNPRSMTINRQKKTSLEGKVYYKEVVVVPLPWLKDEVEDYKTKYGAKKPKPSPVVASPDSDNPFANFVIQETSDKVPAEVRDIQTLVNSAQSNRVTMEMVYSDTKVSLGGEEEEWLCKCILNGTLIGFGHNPDQKKAKHHAAKVAMEFLRKKCPMVKYNRNHDVDQQAAISLQDIMHDQDSSNTGLSSSASKAIEEGNIGHKMLKLMGWSGQGGLGKGGEGISQPIIPIEHIRREGLGFTETGINRDAVVRIVEDYIASGRDEPLVFPSCLTREERKEIHCVAHRFNLKSKSYGKDVERYLLVSNKMSLQQVVKNAAQKGSSTTSGYEVKLPGSEEGYDRANEAQRGSSKTSDYEVTYPGAEGNYDGGYAAQAGSSTLSYEDRSYDGGYAAQRGGSTTSAYGTAGGYDGGYGAQVGSSTSTGYGFGLNSTGGYVAQAGSSMTSGYDGGFDTTGGYTAQGGSSTTSDQGVKLPDSAGSYYGGNVW